MAVNNSRSMNADFKAGSSDGSTKKIASGRGGSVEMMDLLDDRSKLQAQYSVTDNYHAITPTPFDV